MLLINCGVTLINKKNKISLNPKIYLPPDRIVSNYYNKRHKFRRQCFLFNNTLNLKYCPKFPNSEKGLKLS